MFKPTTFISCEELINYEDISETSPLYVPSLFKAILGLTAEVALVVSAGMDIVDFGSLGMRRVPGNGADNIVGNGGNSSARWLVAVLIGNVLDVNMLALGGDPAETALDVAVHVAGLGACDVVAGLQAAIEAVGTNIILARHHFGVRLVAVMNGHWMWCWDVWQWAVLNRVVHSGDQADNSADHHLEEC